MRCCLTRWHIVIMFPMPDVDSQRDIHSPKTFRGGGFTPNEQLEYIQHLTKISSPDGERVVLALKDERTSGPMTRSSMSAAREQPVLTNTSL